MFSWRDKKISILFGWKTASYPQLCKQQTVKQLASKII